jgi:hypothetical protein
MSKKTRDKLKKLFSYGRQPSEQDFSDLIDSSINPIDDGFEITQKDGIKVSPNELGRMISLYADRNDSTNPHWRVELADDKKALYLNNFSNHEGSNLLNDAFSEKEASTIVSISADYKNVGVNNRTPQHALDVNGVVAASGRIGNYQNDSKEIDTSLLETLSVDADGEWHDILTDLQGCHMFEIVAGVGAAEGEGRYALLRATATNTYNPKSWFSFLRSNGIQHHHAYYNSRWDRIHLRWNGGDNKPYNLQMKTVRNYCTPEKKYRIQYSITRLWFDPKMVGSQPNLEEQ